MILDFLKGKYARRKHSEFTVRLRRNSIDFEVDDYVFKEKYHRPFKDLITVSPVILDLGANIGLTIIDFKSVYRDSLIYAYEMDKDNYDLAIRNCKGLTNVHLVNKAIWFESIELQYDKTGNNDAYKLSTALEKPKLSASVKTISIPQIISENNLESIDFVKMDIEGAEYDIFKHDLKWLERVKQIKIEVHYGEEIFSFIKGELDKYGFTTVKDTHHWSTLIGYKDES